MQNAKRNREYRERKKQQALQAPTPSQNDDDDVSVTSRDGIEREIDKEKDIDKEKEREKREKEKNITPPSPLIDSDFKNVVDYFKQKFREPTYQDTSDLSKLYDFYPDGKLIIEAMKIALQNEKPFISYFQKILYNWSKEKSINTYQDFIEKGAQTNGGNQRNTRQQPSFKDTFGHDVGF